MEFSPEEIQFSKEWIKSIYDLKKSLDRWANSNLNDLWEDQFQSSYIQFLLLIDAKGSTNKELAKMSGVSKQSMSKVLNQLTQMGLVKSQISKFDRRSYTIQLTPKGQEIVSESLRRFSEMIIGYKTQIGDHNIEASKKTLELIQQFVFHNQK